MSPVAKRRPWPRAIWLAGFAVITWFGVRLLWFQCDDAFITFRHVSNAMDGHGLCWNPPPFQPVEGYTSFAWAVLLWAVWSWFGVEPPAAANVLSVMIGFGTLALAAVAAFRVRRADGARLPDAVTLLALFTLATNRTFLQWFTGGLETALFNLAFAAWVLLAFRPATTRGAGWLAGWSTAAALTALTRPDGLLLVAATVAVALWPWPPRRLDWRRTLLGLVPLAAVLLHVLWRHSFYGDWLPNTYYAKVTAPWPQAGLRYLACFAFEQGLWPWALMVVAGLVAAFTTGRLRLSLLLTRDLPASAAVATAVVHVGYYVVVVGGDHFEYRVFSYLMPLLMLALLALLAKLSVRPRTAALAFVTYGLFAAVGWLHFALVRPAVAPDYDLLGDKLPGWLQPLVRGYDRDQLWLQMQFVGVRCQAHQKSMDDILWAYPAREHRGVDLTAVDDVPVLQAKVVGYVSWSLADVGSIDLLGLCDRVAARTPARPPLAFLAPALPALLTAADTDRDGRLTLAELAVCFPAAPAPELSPSAAEAAKAGADATKNVRILLVLFAYERDDSLTLAEVAAIPRFFEQFRYMAHERLAPAEYVDAFAPNVTVEDRRTVLRPRATPLTPARVREIEAEWRRRLSEQR